MKPNEYTVEQLADQAREIVNARSFNHTPGQSNSRELAIIKGAELNSDAALLAVLAKYGLETPLHLIAASVHGQRRAGTTEFSQPVIDRRLHAILAVSTSLVARDADKTLFHDDPTPTNLLHYAAQYPERMQMLTKTIRSRTHTTEEDIIETTEILLGLHSSLRDGAL